MHKLLILRFPYESRFGGEERHTMQIAEGLRARGHEVFFVGSDPVLFAEMRSRGFSAEKIWGPKPPVTKKTVVTFLFLWFFFWCRMVPMLWKYRSKGVRTIYCMALSEKLTCTLFARLIGMRVVWIEHARIGRWLTGSPYLVFYWLLAHLTKAVVFTSDLALQQGRWIPHAISIVCGLNMEEFMHARPTALVGVPAGAPAVGTIARFSSDKGVDIFLQAAAAVHREKPDVVFVCCGDGPEESALHSLACTLKIEKNTVFLKNLSRAELGSLYKRLSVVVLASTEFDPFGLVPAEAMTVGKPVIVTTACGIAGHLKNGVTGVIVAPKDADALAGAMGDLLENPARAEKIGHAGEKLIAEQFSEEKMIERFCGLFFGL